MTSISHVLYNNNQMANRKNKFTGYYLPQDLLDSFQRSYPRLATTFIRRAIIRAVRSKEFFDDVFFGTIDEYEDIGQNNPNYILRG